MQQRSGFMHGASVLRRVLELYAAENVSEEQVMRVFEPVGRMIREGRFERRVPRWVTLRSAVSAAAVVAAGLLLLFLP
jgi:hypothetical protein